MNYRHGTNPGDLNKRVTFYTPPNQSAGGWSSLDWVESFSVWAAVKTQKGYRVFNSDLTQWQGKKVLGVRYRPDIRSDMHVRINGVMHEIESLANDDERNQWLTIIIKEVL